MKTTKNLSLKNFIHGDVFLLGIESTIFTESIAENNPYGGSERFPTNTFIILFDSTSNNILATTRKLIKSPSENINAGDIYFKKNDSNSGGELVINKIDDVKTKNLLESSDKTVYTADGFAIIRAFLKEDGSGFPDLSKDDFIILVKSKLDNKPVFNFNTNFIFNSSSILFGAGNA